MGVNFGLKIGKGGGQRKRKLLSDPDLVY